MRICRVCRQEVVECREDSDNPGYYRCPYGHGPWAWDDPGWP